MTARDHDSASDLLDSSSETVPMPPAPGLNGSMPVEDPVSDVLDTIRLQGAVFFLWEPGVPFGIGVADGQTLSSHILTGADCVVSYHIVNKGPCWAAVNGEPPLRLETGDTLVLPHGDAYKIGNTPQYPTPEDEAASIGFFKAMRAGKIPSVVADGGPGPERNSLICGFLGCSMGPYNPLLSTLPRLMRVAAPQDRDDPLSALIAFALSESRQARGGERCLLMRLSETMFVEVLRRHLRSDLDAGAGWLAGLRDPVVNRTLALLHGEVSTAWTLQKIARQVGASRSTLAERFTAIVGLPPIQYLTRWRMQVAANRLRQTGDKVYAIAREVGYDSEEAFSRAFKRVVGVTPRQWRKGA